MLGSGHWKINRIRVTMEIQCFLPWSNFRSKQKSVECSEIQPVYDPGTTTIYIIFDIMWFTLSIEMWRFILSELNSWNALHFHTHGVYSKHISVWSQVIKLQFTGNDDGYDDDYKVRLLSKNRYFKVIWKGENFRHEWKRLLQERALI